MVYVGVHGAGTFNHTPPAAALATTVSTKTTPCTPSTTVGNCTAGSMGDAPKAQCITCHNGNYKPLYGAQMAKHYPAIWGRADWNGAPFPGITPSIAATPAPALGTAPVAAPATGAAAGAPGTAPAGGGLR